jgi:hypothetical protein
MELTPTELLKIINGYALQGGAYDRLAELLETLSPHTPLIKKEESKDIYTRILKIVSGATEVQRNLSQETKDYIFSTDGGFSINDVYNAVGTSTPKEKGLVRKVVSVMCDQGDLEKIGNKTGNYLLVDKSITLTDYKNIKERPSIDLKLPLGIHNRTKFFPSSILGIAGCTGNGKTTWAFNIIRDNQDKMKVKYFYMPELGPEGLKQKLGYFMTPIDTWQFDAICGSNGNGKTQWDNTNIHQKIYPDCLNIIDYLEPPEDAPWKIYHVMNKIAGRLQGGMAIILIQKKEGARYGIGGDWSAKATCFYLSLEWGNVTVQKNTYQEEDTIGRDFNIKDFEIGKGAHIKSLSGWYGEEAKKDKDKVKRFADLDVRDDRPKKEERRDPDFIHED